MIIYKFTSQTTGKCYIGQTTRTISKRWSEHKHSAKTGVESKFYSAIRKYGSEDFIPTILVSNVQKHLLNESENYWMELFDSITNGYNTYPASYYKSDKDKLNLSQRMKINNPMFNEETKQRIRDNHYMKDNKNVWNKGENHPNFNKKFPKTEEQILKQSGSNNPSAKIIEIYDAENNLLFTCNGNFKTICKENNLPYEQLRVSYNKPLNVSKGPNLKFNGYKAIIV